MSGGLADGASYAEFLAWLFEARRGGIDFDLDRVRRCLRRLGNPQASFRARVHIAGTNGKGSTAAYAEALVRAGGLRTGMFTSPHLSRFSERFAIDGVPSPEDEILAAGKQVAAAMVDGEPLTFFDRATVLALVLFARAGVDVAVLEVGLGGRLDATNVVDAEVAAIATIARDHENFLGRELAQIAAEKAGIFKPGQRVVLSAANRPVILALLEQVARERGVAGVVRSEPLPPDWALAMVGEHQRYNAGCALAIATQLAELGVMTAKESAARQALATVQVAGRIEHVPGTPAIFIDGAHNPNAARVLAAALAERHPQGRIIPVIAVSGDKNARAIVEPLIARSDVAVLTRYQQPRSMAPEQLAAAARAGQGGADKELLIEPDIERAVARARAMARPGDIIVIAGSLFLAGEARQLLLDAPADPLVVQDPV